MTAVQMAVAGRRCAVEGKGYSTHGRITRAAGQAEIPLDQFLMPMVLASGAVLSDGELIGDPTEGALVALAAKGRHRRRLDQAGVPENRRAPLRRRVQAHGHVPQHDRRVGKAVIRCFVKGAPDQLLARAATVLDADTDAVPVPVDGHLRELYLAENRRLGEQGLRVMTTARRDFDPGTFDPGVELLPLVTDLELFALVGIVDPPRPAARASVAQAKSAGIRIRMITGDHAVTAAARQLGINGKVISGAQFDAMSDDEAMDTIDDVGVIACVTPSTRSAWWTCSSERARPSP